jgi:hypothetical protein
MGGAASVRTIASAVRGGDKAAAAAATAVARVEGAAGNAPGTAATVAQSGRLPARATEEAELAMRARASIGTDLTPAQRKALYDAHVIGRGEPGRAPGSLAARGNYTNRQLDAKVKRLREGGFNEDQLRTLMREGIAGDGVNVGDAVLVPRSSGGFSPGRVVSDGPFIKIQSADGQVHYARLDQWDQAANGQIARKWFRDPQTGQMLPASGPIRFRDSLGNVIDGQVTGTTLRGQLAEVHFADGYKHIDPHRLAPASRWETSAEAGTPARQFRDAFDQGRIGQGEELYVSVDNGTERLPARVVGYTPDRQSIVVETADGARAALPPGQLQTVRVSETARQVFRDGPRAGPPQPAAARPRGWGDGRAIHHDGPDAAQHLHYAQQVHVLPTQSIRVHGGNVSISDIVPMSNGRYGVLMEVEVNGQRYLRTAYRSNSQGTWRVLPARNRDIAKPAYDKAMGEEGLALPPELQEELGRRLRAGQVRRDLGPEHGDYLVDAGTHNNRSMEDYMRYRQSPDYIGKQVQVREVVPIGQDRLIHDHVDPASVRIPEGGLKPDFSRPLRTFRTESSTAGHVEGMVYRSRDGSIEYTVFRDQGGHIWFGDASSTRAALTSHGVPSEAIDLGALGMPRWEYHEQIPGQLQTGAAHPQLREYGDAWPTLRRMPDIQEWYRVNGVALPP